LASKKPISNQSFEAGNQRPFWFDLPNLFYERLRRAAAEFGMTPAEIVQETAKLKLREVDEAEHQAATAAVKGKARDEIIRDFMSRVSACRWTEEEEQPKAVPQDFSPLFWLDLPESFYRNVSWNAALHEMTQKQFITKALTQFIRQEREARRPLQLSGAQAQIVKEFTRRLGKLRWKDKDEKERRAHARAMAKKRWENRKS
jgi:hypothetical protein